MHNKLFIQIRTLNTISTELIKADMAGNSSRHDVDIYRQYTVNNNKQITPHPNTHNYYITFYLQKIHAYQL